LAKCDKRVERGAAEFGERRQFHSGLPDN